MKFIKYTDEEMPVKAVIEISGTELWKYYYRTDDSSFENSNKLGKELTIDLGPAKNLKGDVHDWKIFLGNMHNETKKIKLSIKWMQGENELAKWIPGEANGEGEVPVKANDGPEITSACTFIKS